LAEYQLDGTLVRPRLAGGSKSFVPSGQTVKDGLKAMRRKSRMRALLLALPLLLFTLVGYIVPILFMLERSIDNSIPHGLLTRTSAALADWNGHDLPGEAAFRAVAVDLSEAEAAGRTALLGKYLNYDREGLRTLIVKTVRALPLDNAQSTVSTLGGIDKAWLDVSTWQVLERAGRPYTFRNLLTAIDLKQSPDGSITRLPQTSRIHLDILLRTILVSAAVCALCIVIGIPVAFVLATVGDRMRNILLMLVLLPFWTPVLVRTTAWIVLLQNEGVINRLLINSGLAEAPLPLIFSRTGVLIAMTHVLLPYMIIPIYVAMKHVPENYVRASLSLGADPFTTLRRVYFPLISPGIRNGSMLVFVLALGYYITPALVGGPADQMLSYLISFHTSTTLNWGLASALSLLLLVSMGLLFLGLTKVLGPVKFQFEAGR
jgi:putative spermidine/putrescine transport system permease protein